MTYATLSDDVPVNSFQRLDPNTVLRNHALLSTRNPHQARASVENVFCRHSLRTSRPVDPINFVHRSASLSTISFNLIQYGADVEVTVNDVNRDKYILVAPLSGKAEVQHRDQYAGLSCGHFIVLDPKARFHFDMLADHSHLAIGIPSARLANYVMSHMERPIDTREFSAEPHLITESNRSFFDFMAYVCGEMDSPASLTAIPFVAQAIEESFLSLLLSAVLTNKSHTGPVLNDLAIPYYLRGAENFILANLTEEITAEDILKAANVPMRTLYHAFQKYRGVSPVSWLKQRRLRQARLDLMHPSHPDLTVTEIANLYQSPHVGRFASAYFEEFGEMPSDTLKSAKNNNF